MGMRPVAKLLIIFSSAIVICGCASLGPKTVVPDRIAYIQEISDSWKKQMLYNIVKLRYFDPPTFLDVSSVINQYGTENQINASAGWTWPKPSTEAYSAGVGGYARYSDKPTITYIPLSGQKFTKNLLTPIPPYSVVSLIQSGWPIDLIFPFAVKSINGVRNNSSIANAPQGKPEFYTLVQSMGNLQRSGITDIRLEKMNEKEAVVFVIADEANREASQEDSECIRRILKIKPGLSKYTIVSGLLPSQDNEIAIQTRSMLEIMLEIAAAIDVPAQHVTEGRARPPALVSNEQPLARIHSGKEKPADAFAAVQYRNYWFWIDDKDLLSKRNFALMMIFLSLTETEEKGSGPLLTIGG
jgi:hypothetical protein